MFVSSTGISQEEFVWKYSNAKELFTLYEYSSNKFVFVGTTLTNEHLNDSALIIIRDLENPIIRRNTYKFQNKPCHYSLLWHENNEFIAFGTTDPANVNVDTNYFFAVGYDSLLHQLWETVLMIPRISLRVRDVEGLPNDNLLLSLNGDNRYWVPPSPIPQFYLMEITKNGIIKKLHEDSIGLVQDITLHPDSNRIFCFGEDLAWYTPDAQNAVMIFDTALNYLGVKPFYYDDIGDPPCGIWLNSDTLLLSAMDYAPSRTDIGIYKVIETDSMKIVKENTYYYPSTFDAPSNQGICITKDNKIVQCGNYDASGWFRGWVGIYDMHLNLLDYKIFSDEIGKIHSSRPIATADSGFIIHNTFISYDTTIPDTVFYIKYNKNSSLSAIKELGKNAISEALLFPNPGTEYFDVVVPYNVLAKNDEIIIQLFDNKGILINEHPINSFNSRINTSNMPKGIYLYRVLSKKQIIYQGKWIKQ